LNKRYDIFTIDDTIFTIANLFEWTIQYLFKVGFYLRNYELTHWWGKSHDPISVYDWSILFDDDTIYVLRSIVSIWWIMSVNSCSCLNERYDIFTIDDKIFTIANLFEWTIRYLFTIGCYLMNYELAHWSGKSYDRFLFKNWRYDTYLTIVSIWWIYDTICILRSFLFDELWVDS
jgi:hypothetical protein